MILIKSLFVGLIVGLAWSAIILLIKTPQYLPISFYPIAALAFLQAYAYFRCLIVDRNWNRLSKDEPPMHVRVPKTYPSNPLGHLMSSKFIDSQSDARRHARRELHDEV